MRLRTLTCLAIVLLLGLSFFGCSNRPTTPAESVDAPPETVSEGTPEITLPAPEIDPAREIVALVNGYPIYTDEFEPARGALLNQYAQMYAQFGMDISMLLAGADGRLFELGIEAEALQQLIQLRLTQQEAILRGIVVTSEEIQQEFDSQYDVFLASQELTEEELAAYLEPQGRTVESFKDDAKEYIGNQLLAVGVQTAVVGPLEISDEQLSEYFDENKANYSTDEQVRASHILVDTREEAEAIMAELNEGADFAQLAQERSTCPSADDGGDLKWFGQGAMVAEFDEAVFALSVGEMSGIVETDFGYHIILLTDHQDAFSPELADVIDQVRTDVESQMGRELAIEWYESVYAAADLEVHEPLLHAVVKQREDIDAAIEILEQAQSDGTSEDPFLPFVLGTFYEKQLTDAVAERTAALEASESEDEIAAFDAQISEYGANALAAYGLALEAVGEDQSIVSTIAEIEALLGTPEEQAP